MTAAVWVTGICIVASLGAAVALFVVGQSPAAWATLVVALIGVTSLLAMIASTSRATATVTSIDEKRR